MNYKHSTSKAELSAKVNFDQQAAVARNSYEVYGWRPTNKQLRINLEKRNQPLNIKDSMGSLLTSNKSMFEKYEVRK
jgi:hypothetical protein